MLHKLCLRQYFNWCSQNKTELNLDCRLIVKITLWNNFIFNSLHIKRKKRKTISNFECPVYISIYFFLKDVLCHGVWLRLRIKPRYHIHGCRKWWMTRALHWPSYCRVNNYKKIHPLNWNSTRPGSNKIT